MRKNIIHLFRLTSAILICTAAFFAVSCKKVVGARTQLVFGTVCTVNAYTDGTAKLYDELFACLNTLDKEFSANRDDSEVAKINTAAGIQPVQVTPDVLYITKIALSYASLTGGAFDPTIGPVVKLWGINTDHARVPSKEELAQALPLVNWQNVTVKDDTVFLREKGMKLDFGAIVKGYAADRLAAILKARKVKRAVIDLGGNVYVYGKKEDGSAWRVGIKNPGNPEGAPALVLSLQNSSVVTSGVYERFFIQDGIRYHHIIDPKTGYPVNNGLTSVSIICESSTAADALSTSLFILGPDKGFNLLSTFSVSASPSQGKKKTDTVDGMGMWLFTGNPDSAGQTAPVTAEGTPVLAPVSGLTKAVSAVFVTEDKKIFASEDLEPVLEVKDESFGTPAYR